MAVLSVTPAQLAESSPSPTPALTVHVAGEMGRPAVDALRTALRHALRDPSLREPSTPPADGPAVELDLREVTVFPRLAVAVLVSAHRALGRRLRIRANAAVLALVEDAGLTGVLQPVA